jgi:hypothetical protein
MKKTFKLCVKGIIGGLALMSQVTNATTYHMSPNGSSTINCGALSQPCSLNKVNQTLVAGDTAVLHAGTYSEQIRPVNSGENNSNRIIYRVAGDSDVILNSFGQRKKYRRKIMGTSLRKDETTNDDFHIRKSG